MEQNQKFNVKLCMISILVFSFFLRILIAIAYQQDVDIETFNIPWALGAGEGVFSMYARLPSLDYPPIFPVLLSFLSSGIKLAIEMDFWPLKMLIMKFIPICFDMGIVILLYKIGAKSTKLFGMMMAGLWIVNISAIFNVSYWGQIDSMLLFFILLTFWAFEEKSPVLGCFYFALGCLAKLQMCYFFPVLVLELLCYYKKNVVLKALGAGLLTGIAGWLPFMIGSKELMLPLRIYAGGIGKYDGITINAFNGYGFLGFNWIEGIRSVFGGNFDSQAEMMTGGFTYQMLGNIFFALLFALLVGMYLYGKKTDKRIPMAIHGLIWINGIFMLTLHMHERYQLPAMMLACLAYIITKKNVFLWVYFFMIAITFLNQATVLFAFNIGSYFNSLFFAIQKIGSVANIAMLFFLMWEYFTMGSKGIGYDREI